MAGRNTQPFQFKPRSVVDALDGGSIAPGGLAAATNLIFDPSNPFCLECRPAAIKTYSFSGISGAGVVSVSYVVGDICYGMISSSLLATYDQPFAYNLATNSLVTVSGTQDEGTLPFTPTTTGKWNPPTMALVGVLLYVTHPGFVGGDDAFFGWFDTTDPTAPVWHAGNTTTNLLPTVPTCVSGFNNRAWFACGNALNFTDTLTTNISDATHVLTIGDSEPITALAQQPIVTTVQGQIQSLVAFKQYVFATITGDAVTGDLALNLNSSEVGTISGRTTACTPKGIMFATIDGVRIIGKDGMVSEPNADLKIPFVYALDATRSSACYNNNIYRISVQNGHANGNPIEEYWYDFRTNGWTGPHSFYQSMSSPYGNTFIAFNNVLKPGLWTSDVVQSGTSTFTENGSSMAFLEQTVPMPDDGGLYEGSAVLSVVDMELPQVAQSYTFVASDVNHGVLSQAQISTNSSGAIWNGFNWGTGVWTATSYGLDRYNIPWTNPLVFSRMVWQITGTSRLGLKIGKLTIGHQPTRYVRT
jgi:hypothetical protein